MISGNKTVAGKVKKQGNEGEEKENVTTLKQKEKRILKTTSIFKNYLFFMILIAKAHY